MNRVLICLFVIFYILLPVCFVNDTNAFVGLMTIDSGVSIIISFVYIVLYKKEKSKRCNKCQFITIDSAINSLNGKITELESEYTKKVSQLNKDNDDLKLTISKLSEDLELLNTLNISFDKQKERLSELESLLQEKTDYLTKLQFVLLLKTKLINRLQSDLNDKERQLELLSSQCKRLSELESLLQEKTDYSNKLQSELELKTELISKLQSDLNSKGKQLELLSRQIVGYSKHSSENKHDSSTPVVDALTNKIGDMPRVSFRSLDRNLQNVYSFVDKYIRCMDENIVAERTSHLVSYSYNSSNGKRALCILICTLDKSLRLYINTNKNLPNCILEDNLCYTDITSITDLPKLDSIMRTVIGDKHE